MHIKQLIIQGFKTYKDETIIDPFVPGHNIILGKNGSGKSNIFDAIQFVLSDKYSNLRSDERQRLLHEGSGREVMTASVELIFDNTDARFPIEKEEIALKRTIGLKKDEYFLDNKHMSKAEVVSLLESAGLSRSNPYYIVEQGKVQHLIKMKNSERLELLKEIAGTRTYDERRKESLKIMADTDKRRTQIQEVVEYIEKRLSELEEEKQELKAYQELDSSRRCLEYAIYDHDLRNASEKLGQIEESREKSSERTNELYTKQAQATKLRQDAEEETKKIGEDVGRLRGEKAGLEKDREAGIKRRSKFEFTVKSAQEKIAKFSQTRTQATDELKELADKIKKTKKELEAATKAFDSKAKEEEKIRERIRFCEQRVAFLFDKEGRKEQFKTRKDRDAFLRNQIKEIKKTIETEEGKLKDLEKEKATVIASVERGAQSSVERKSRVEDIKSRIKKQTDALQLLKTDRDKATDERKEMWRSEDAVKKRQQDITHDLERADLNLQQTMDKATFRGLQTVEQIVAEKRIAGYHGPLIRLFTCEKKFQKCVETTAGNSLFHLVVDTDAIAATIIKELNARKGGRVTFMPLNQIRGGDVAYPKSSDVIPMVEKLVYEPRYKKAVTQVFGKTLITRDLKVASEFARTHDLNTITLAGDQVNKKGALTGGYIDNKYSRLEAQETITKLKAQREELKAELETLSTRTQNKDQEVTRVMSEMEKNSAQAAQLRNELGQLQLDDERWKKDKEIADSALIRIAKGQSSLAISITQLREKVVACEEEMKTELVEKLDASDQKDLTDRSAELSQLKERLISHTSERSKAEVDKNKLQSLLDTNLLKREEELTSMLSSAAQDDVTDQFDKEEHELAVMTQSIKDLEARIKDVEGRLDKAVARDQELQTELENLRSAEAEAILVVQRESKSAEKLMARRAGFLQTRDDCIKKIKDLGAIPVEATTTDKYKKQTQKELMTKLEKVNAKLAKYTHVNKKAIDQYMSFDDQRRDLIERKADLDKGRKAITDLVDHLDQKKDEAIERTFKAIAKHFTTVFAELVPDGRATLVMQTKKKGEQKDSDDEEEGKEEEGKSAAQQYSGVGIKVSFGSAARGRRAGAAGAPAGDTPMLQLSGGQQSIVALSLIFAIQRCDPSPFYLFDEIDSNLDAVHRTSVARMIAGQSKGTQFITTTFRPEMLSTGEKFYGVTFTNKTSRVAVLSKEEAKELILLVEKEYEEAGDRR